MLPEIFRNGIFRRMEFLFFAWSTHTDVVLFGRANPENVVVKNLCSIVWACVVLLPSGKNSSAGTLNTGIYNAAGEYSWAFGKIMKWLLLTRELGYFSGWLKSGGLRCMSPKILLPACHKVWAFRTIELDFLYGWVRLEGEPKKQLLLICWLWY